MINVETPTNDEVCLPDHERHRSSTNPGPGSSYRQANSPKLLRMPGTAGNGDHDNPTDARVSASTRPAAPRNFSFPFTTPTPSPSPGPTASHPRRRRGSSTAPFPSLLQSGSPATSRIATPELAFKPELLPARTAALSSFRFRVNLGRDELIRENKQTLTNYLKSFDWDAEEAAGHYDQRVTRIQASRASWEENEEFKRRWTAVERSKSGKETVNGSTTASPVIGISG